MAEFGQITDYVKRWEGGLSSALTDSAKLDPVLKRDPRTGEYAPIQRPGTGIYVKRGGSKVWVEPEYYHTNKGVTWTSFKALAKACGYQATAELFLEMPDAVWLKIMKVGYWDAVCGDRIRHQAVANLLCDYAWGSGPGTAVRRLQQVLNRRYDKELAVDGAMGPRTLKALNDVPDGAQLYRDLAEDRRKHLQYLLTLPQYAANVGWIARLDDFEKWQKERL